MYNIYIWVWAINRMCWGVAGAPTDGRGKNWWFLASLGSIFWFGVKLCVLFVSCFLLKHKKNIVAFAQISRIATDDALVTRPSQASLNGSPFVEDATLHRSGHERFRDGAHVDSQSKDPTKR